MSRLRKLFNRKQQSTPEIREQTKEEHPSQHVADSRQYLVNSSYQLPKDDEEDDRLDFQHHALFHALGNHYVAPIVSPQSLILDVGAGTGIWAQEMARLFPTSTVIGLDLADTSFQQSTHPNCLLRLGNVLTGLPFPDALFSYTHQRLLVAGIPAERWPSVVRELVRVTRKHGWIELVEIDNQMQHAGPATARLQAFMQEVGTSLGFDWNIIHHLGELLQQAGLQHVEMQPIPVAVGEWAGRVGQMMKHNLITVINAVRGRYCLQAGITGAAFDQMVQDMAQEWENYHPSCTFFAAYGKRETL